MDEFGFIARLLSPLASEPGAFGLTDDAAALQVPAGHELIVTKDALVEGVHFTGKETAGNIARKVLRVNLSDLAAMGAEPYGYLLALMLPKAVAEAWLTAFAAGLKADQSEFGLSLLGGDTTRTPGVLSISVTMMGLVPTGKTLRRNGAKVGDAIYVSGTIGDAALGLSIAKETILKIDATTRDFLYGRYLLPQPRIELGQQLRSVATSSMDISDGLVQDLGHICAASEVGAVIEWDKIPLSKAAIQSNLAIPQTILAGGDDYELLFTAPANVKLEGITRIGTITQGSAVIVLDAQGEEIKLARKGYKHF
jgi:thiamine-monophosphate kinase